MENKIENEIKEKHPEWKAVEWHPIKIFGTYAYKIGSPIEKMKSFPREGDKFLGMIPGTGKETKAPKWFVERAKDLGADIIAIADGTRFTIWAIDEIETWGQ